MYSCDVKWNEKGMVKMKKRVLAAVVSLSILASVSVGSVSAADLSEMRACKSYSSMIENHFNWLKSRVDAYIDYLIDIICNGGANIPSTMSFGDESILM